MVAPLAGAWIEIVSEFEKLPPADVAPLAGAWIEMEKYELVPERCWSLPSRERGLKSFQQCALWI